MQARRYPADVAEAGLRVFRTWFGARYARSVTVNDWRSDGQLAVAKLEVGRRWPLQAFVLNTCAWDTTLAWEGARAAIEGRLDLEGRSLALWTPRGASLPAGEPGLSELAAAVAEASARPLADGRLEVRREVTLSLRRTAREGSVVTALGGLAPHWARFTGKVAGTFQLNSLGLLRLPSDDRERESLFDRVLLAAGQPEVDDTVTIAAVDAWTASPLDGDGACVIGTPSPEGDEWSAGLRRALRRLLQAAQVESRTPGSSTALVVLGASTYADEERLTLTLRGMDPGLWAGYDFVAGLADGVLRPLATPAHGSLPWEA